MNRRRRVGEAARERIKAGGVLSKARPSATQSEWQATKVLLWYRAKGRCECCGATAGPFDPEHAVPRSQGGGDHLDGLWLTCRSCHRSKEAPYEHGRLKVIVLGGGRFRWEMWRGVSKSEAQCVWVKESA